MITPRNARIFGILTLIALFVLLVFVWFGVFPESMYVMVFLVALAIVLMRVTVRLVLQRNQRLRNSSTGDSGNTAPKNQ